MTENSNSIDAPAISIGFTGICWPSFSTAYADRRASATAAAAEPERDPEPQALREGGERLVEEHGLEALAVDGREAGPAKAAPLPAAIADGHPGAHEFVPGFCSSLQTSQNLTTNSTATARIAVIPSRTSRFTGAISITTVASTHVSAVATRAPITPPGAASSVVARPARGERAQQDRDQQHDLDSLAGLVEAEVRALRAQISPHFIYNSLGAIASFVRTDPERASDLLLEFADFTRYSFRRHGEFTTLADELRSVEQYLLLEQARFGERLRVVLRIAPEVLPVQVPFLSLQPLVENAVKHGLEGRAEGGTITVVASDLDRECEISIEDDGAGADPEHVRRALAGHQRVRGAGQRRRTAAAHLRRRVRPRRGDRTRRRHPRRRARARSTPRGCPHEPTPRSRREPAGPPTGLRVLVIDDERPALDELAFLLERDPRVHAVLTSDSATDALRVLQELSVDAVFLDISMPGLSGLELAQVLARFKTPPPVVFVTAHEQHAVEAFDLNAVDYVLKPVREERLAEAVRRVVEGVHPTRSGEEEQVAVELGGVTRFISRGDITYVEAQGDYARLHTAEGSHLLRTPLAALEEEWQPAGFVRIHRSLLVSLPHVEEVRTEGGRCTVLVGGTELAVSRRHTRALRDLLVRRNRPGGSR